MGVVKEAIPHGGGHDLIAPGVRADAVESPVSCDPADNAANPSPISRNQNDSTEKKIDARKIGYARSSVVRCVA